VHSERSPDSLFSSEYPIRFSGGNALARALQHDDTAAYILVRHGSFTQTKKSRPLYYTMMEEDDEVYVSEDEAREENARIFKALKSLHNAGVKAAFKTRDDEPTKRTWGSLCVAFGDQQEARLHACLRPFLYTKTPGKVLKNAARALARLGIVPVKDMTDVFEVCSAMEGVRKIQLFPLRDHSAIEEYVLLS